jgi:hypothetical protein
MAHCYICGRQIKDKSQQLRRKVKTGEWVRKRYPKPRAQEMQTHYGMRIVCKRCAKLEDLFYEKQEYWRLEEIVVLMAILTLLMILLYGPHF